LVPWVLLHEKEGGRERDGSSEERKINVSKYFSLVHEIEITRKVWICNTLKI
jgi:hypothetical protein